MESKLESIKFYAHDEYGKPLENYRVAILMREDHSDYRVFNCYITPQGEFLDEVGVRIWAYYGPPVRWEDWSLNKCMEFFNNPALWEDIKAFTGLMSKHANIKYDCGM